MTNPTNELYLLSNVDLDPDYNYTLDFDNETAQHAYFPKSSFLLNAFLKPAKL